MNPDRSERHIVWDFSLLASYEHCTLFDADDGDRFYGVVVVALADLP